MDSITTGEDSGKREELCNPSNPPSKLLRGRVWGSQQEVILVIRWGYYVSPNIIIEMTRDS